MPAPPANYWELFEYRVMKELAIALGSIPGAVTAGMMADALGGYLAQRVTDRSPVVVSEVGEIVWVYEEARREGKG